MSEPKSLVELLAAEVKGSGVTFCPNPRMPLWSNHPRVFIDIGSTGEGRCPYCGTVYRLKAGEKLHAH
ncbi:MAG: zinc-finger domain-containing protein [Burkholderiales bacterium]|nr:zinc-finger domain-containing protein [Burkholderiales bacterium]MDE2397361.1 zinc-finger domain-containing protein [Burkholderiales bacterium]MDE2453020.1 zinc-finger domain-containing protein [Burkholderiales bacterium]